jgi:hypothetical protein
MAVVLWVMKSCNLVAGYQCFGRTYRLEDGGDTVLRNVHKHLQDYASS